jgi:hypothetical protein
VWTPSVEAAPFVSAEAVIAAFKNQQLLMRFDSFRFSSRDDLPDLEDFDIPLDRIVPFKWADSFASIDLRLSRADFNFPVETPYGARTGQIIILHLYGLELETRAIEALRPATSKPEPKQELTASVDPSSELEPERHPGGSDPIHPWEDAALYVDKHVEDTERPLPRHKNGKPHIQSAIDLMLEYFDKNKLRAPAEETVRRWIKANPERVARWWMTPQL